MASETLWLKAALSGNTVNAANAIGPVDGNFTGDVGGDSSSEIFSFDIPASGPNSKGGAGTFTAYARLRRTGSPAPDMSVRIKQDAVTILNFTIAPSAQSPGAEDYVSLPVNLAFITNTDNLTAQIFSEGDTDTSSSMQYDALSITASSPFIANAPPPPPVVSPVTFTAVSETI